MNTPTSVETEGLPSALFERMMSTPKETVECHGCQKETTHRPLYPGEIHLCKLCLKKGHL